MKEATPAYLQLIREMGEWYRLWQNALPSADSEYIDFVHSEYEIAKLNESERGGGAITKIAVAAWLISINLSNMFRQHVHLEAICPARI